MEDAREVEGTIGFKGQPDEDIPPQTYPEEKKKKDILEYLYLLLVKPTVGMQKILDARPTFWAAMVVIFVGLSAAVGDTIVGASLCSERVKAPLELSVIVNLVGMACFWVILTALVHLFAEWFGGEGKATRLFVGLGFASLPQIFTAPLALIANVQTEAGVFGLYILFKFLLWIWTLCLQVISIKIEYNLSKTKAVLALITPFYFYFLLIGVLITLFILLAVPSMEGGLSSILKLLETEGL